MLITLADQTDLYATGGEELVEWRETLRRNVPGARFTPQYKAGAWDGTYLPGRWLGKQDGLYSIQLGRGMLARLVRDFKDAEIDFRIQLPSELDLGDLPEKLYDHQGLALGNAQRVPWGRFSLATNAGKGAVIALLARASERAGERVLILSDEVAVVDALQGEIANWISTEPALVEAGCKEPPDALVVIGMVPTIARRVAETRDVGKKKVPTELAMRWQAWLGDVRMGLLDEADKATAKTWTRILSYMSGTTRRYGFSGSFPKEDSLDDLKLEEILGPALQSVRNVELVDKGISARPTVVLHPFRGVIPKANWQEWKIMKPTERRQYVFDHAVLLNEHRHELVRSLLRPDLMNAIIVNRIEHGEELERSIPGSVFLDGSVTKAKRKKALEQFEAGEFNTLIVTKILDRGSNRLGKVDNIVFASAEGSNRQTLQRLGRGLRRGDGKLEVVLHDIIDSGHDYLSRLAKRRIELYNDEQFEVRIAA